MNLDLVAQHMLRFWSKVSREPHPKGCWIWEGGKNSNGYGMFWLNNHTVAAHRISFLLANGELPAELDVLHQCDTPLCVNPGHLFSGTQRDNGQDMARKGRSAVGVKHGMSKLGDSDVIEIRSRRDSGERLQDLANIYGVTATMISFIARRKNWRHLP